MMNGDGGGGDDAVERQMKGIIRNYLTAATYY